MSRTEVHKSYYVINGITFYRIVAAPLMLVFIFTGQYDIFKWMLPVSFFTDLIDGFLARKYKVTSLFGSRLDSIADDLTIVVAIVALFVFKKEFIALQTIPVYILLGLYLLQTFLAFYRYGKITSFHTYVAKAAALVQGCFLIFIFLLPEPLYPLFYLTVFLTGADLVEESILVILLPRWEANVKGLYWVMRRKNSRAAVSISNSIHDRK